MLAASILFRPTEDSCNMYDITAIGDSSDLMNFFACGVSSSSMSLGLGILFCSRLREASFVCFNLRFSVLSFGDLSGDKVCLGSGVIESKLVVL